MTSLVVITAGISQPSSSRLLADRLAAATRSTVAARGDAVQVDVVELREYARDLADHLVTGFPSANLGAVISQVSAADSLIVVSPIFSSSYSGLFKLFFDVLEPGLLEGKPVLLGATAGTARHSLALEFAMRPLFAYLRADVMPTAVFAASEDFGSSVLSLSARVDRAAGELAAAVGRADRPGQVDPFADPTPFEQLLVGAS